VPVEPELGQSADRGNHQCYRHGTGRRREPLARQHVRGCPRDRARLKGVPARKRRFGRRVSPRRRRSLAHHALRQPGERRGGGRRRGDWNGGARTTRPPDRGRYEARDRHVPIPLAQWHDRLRREPRRSTRSPWNGSSDGPVEVSRSMSPNPPRQDRETNDGPDASTEERGWQQRTIPGHAASPLRQPYRSRG
jgi:hypothetical protein